MKSKFPTLRIALAMLAAVALSNPSLAVDIVLTPSAGGAVSVTGGGVKFPDGTIQSTAATPPCFDPNNRFKDCGDGTVFDKTTGLIWEKKTACAVVTLTDPHCVLNTYAWTLNVAPFTEPTGTLYSDFLERLNDLKTPNDGTATPCFAGYCDWRIPTIGELRSILLAPFPICPSIPCIDAIFGPTQASRYWSSSSVASNPGLAWDVSGSSGFSGFVSNNGKSSVSFARAVRSGR